MFFVVFTYSNTKCHAVLLERGVGSVFAVLTPVCLPCGVRGVEGTTTTAVANTTTAAVAAASTLADTPGS
jgi:hypothetical protein